MLGSCGSRQAKAMAPVSECRRVLCHVGNSRLVCWVGLVIFIVVYFYQHHIRSRHCDSQWGQIPRQRHGECSVSPHETALLIAMTRDMEHHKKFCNFVNSVSPSLGHGKNPSLAGMATFSNQAGRTAPVNLAPLGH